MTRPGAAFGGLATTVGGDETHVTDWLEQAPDDLVILPRAELDRRELAAYSAGWADVVEEQLPAVRRAYEQRITAAYLQGPEDARTGRRPRRVRDHDHVGGDVIQLPYVQLLSAPPELTRAEERVEQERVVADGPRDQAAQRAPAERRCRARQGT